MLLIDSSVFVLWSKRPAVLAQFAARQFAVCPPVVQEIMQGAREDVVAKWRGILETAVMIESPVPLNRFEEAAAIYRMLRTRSVTIRKSFDCLIAAIAIHHDVPLAHHDRDFTYIAKHTTLRAINVSPSASRS